ncbi:MAG: hypothetical protein NZ522_05000, partial [Chitinophagales bacterium]|nr:hypothetical protein [Chitinophagales bacterium]
IKEIETQKGKPKVLHAEPLFIDLIRDLGARKGEKEWNFGFGLTDKGKNDEYLALVEYEFAPIDRLGIEFEIPARFYIPYKKNGKDSTPSSRIESLKMAAQWSFLVSDKYKTTCAVGFIQEIKFADLRGFNVRQPLQSNVFNPFLIAAKRWGNNFHTLLYTGPHIEFLFKKSHVHFAYQINSNFHYMIHGTRNFVGIEFNKEVFDRQFNMSIRPQIRLGVLNQLMLGIVSGIPINRNTERYSFFTRIIYEPGHRITHWPMRKSSNKKLLSAT